jgi:hypothetical protein
VCPRLPREEKSSVSLPRVPSSPPLSTCDLTPSQGISADWILRPSVETDLLTDSLCRGGPLVRKVVPPGTISLISVPDAEVIRLDENNLPALDWSNSGRVHESDSRARSPRHTEQFITLSLRGWWMSAHAQLSPPSPKPFGQDLRAGVDRCPILLYSRHGT